MTVQEAIDELNKVKDKGMIVQDMIGELIKIEVIPADNSLIQIPFVLIT